MGHQIFSILLLSIAPASARRKNSTEKASAAGRFARLPVVWVRKASRQD